jgi:hypothetical protein
MIEVFFTTENDLMFAEFNISLKERNETIYRACENFIQEELGFDVFFKIILIRHKFSVIRNEELLEECKLNYFREEYKQITKEWKDEFNLIFGKLKGNPKNINIFIVELGEKTKHLELEYNKIVEKYNGYITEESRFAKKIRGLYASTE